MCALRRQISGHLVAQMVSNGLKMGKNFIIQKIFWHGNGLFFPGLLSPYLFEYGQNILICAPCREFPKGRNLK